MNPIQNFAFEENLVRVIEKDGEPWFVGKDICGALGLKNHNDALSDLDEDEKGVATTDPLYRTERGGGAQEATIISEPGVYRLVFRSRKPEAERFKRWLAHEVIPQIRKTGRYIPSERAITEPVPTEPLIAERRLALSAVTEARILYGTAAARALWEASPALPQVRRPGREEGLTASPAHDVLLCLLEMPVYDECMSIAEIARQPDAEGLRALDDVGVRLIPGDGLWIVPEHPRLRGYWQQTRWRDGLWVTMLKRIDGVTRGNPRMSIGGHQGRPLWLPASILRLDP